MELSFPSLRERVEAQWMPLLLRPFVDSPERLVIGVAAVSRDGFHLEHANSFRRLDCLFGARSGEMIDTAKLGLKSFEKQIAQHGFEISSAFRPPMSGIFLGEPREAVGLSLEEISAFWLEATSSLYERRREVLLHIEDRVALRDDVERRIAPEAQVVRNVLIRQPDLLRNFRPHFVKAKKLPATMTDVDYKSDAIVVNIDFIAPNFRAQTVNRIIKRMWDLEIDRGSNDNAPDDSHEMLVEVPQADEMSRDESEKLRETVSQLTWQADQRNLRFRPMSSTEDISTRILEAEAA